MSCLPQLRTSEITPWKLVSYVKGRGQVWHTLLCLVTLA